MNAQTYAARGYRYVSDVLQNDISTTLIHTGGGGSSTLPTSVALRGPDPTETLVDIDGHRVNNGNTGDFDLSLLDPVQFTSIELVKGISPSSLVGPDTIDGAINLQTLEPTAETHALARFTAGSYNAFGSTLQTTGTANRLGYALSLHRETSNGEVHEDVLDERQGGDVEAVGSNVLSSTGIAKVRYAFGRTGDGYAELSFRDQTQVRDLSAGLSTTPAPAGTDDGDARYRRTALDADDGDSLRLVDGFEGTTLSAHNAGYGIDVRTPIGGAGSDGVSSSNLLVRAFRSDVSQSIVGPGADISPYEFNGDDRIDDLSAEFDRQFAHASLTAQYDVRSESLRTDFVDGVVVDEATARRASPQRELRAPFDAGDDGGPSTLDLALGQTQRSLALRYTYDPAAIVHLTAATYYSRFSIFGSSLDPRFGAVVTPDARTAIRFSVGSTFQVPQLPELFVPPAPPVVVGQAIATGNPNLKPDRATEYGLGFEHHFGPGSRDTTLSLDLYRVNLRDAAVALAPTVDPQCGPVASGGDGTACPFTYAINAGNAVYQGFELQGDRDLAPFTTLRAGFAVRSAYLTTAPPAIQDGTLVVHEQILGLPLQKGTLGLTCAPPRGFTTFASLVYEGSFDELNRAPYATLAAGIGYRLGGFDLSLSGTNLTDVYDNRFTQAGGGLAYPIAGGLTASTDAFALEGTAITFGITRHL